MFLKYINILCVFQKHVFLFRHVLKIMSMFAVGGFVRDYLLKVSSKDLDIVCPDFENIDNLVSFAKKELGLVKVINPEYGRVLVLAKTCTLGHFANMWLELNGSLPQQIAVDLLLPRKDLDHNGRQCKTEISSLSEDLSRRDFTINALAMSADGQIIDNHNGIKHIEEKKLIFVGDMSQRIEEDYLRILRLLRFAVTKNFEIPIEFSDYLEDKELEIANKITDLVSVDRIREELTKMFLHDSLKSVEIINSLPRPIRSVIFENIKLKPTQF